MKLARLAAAAAIPVLTILSLAGSASAAGSVVVTPNPVPAAGAPQALVVGSGLTPGDQIYMSQCVDAPRQANPASFNPFTDCEAVYATAAIDAVDASGNFTDNFDIYTGVVRPTTQGGVGFTCDSTKPCRIRLSVGTFAATAGQVFAPLTFEVGTPATTTTTVVDPTPVVPESPLPIMLPIGAAAVLGAGYMMLRKGRNSSINA
jgi:hypothetical protein